MVASVAAWVAPATIGREGREGTKNIRSIISSVHDRSRTFLPHTWQQQHMKSSTSQKGHIQHPQITNFPPVLSITRPGTSNSQTKREMRVTSATSADLAHNYLAPRPQNRHKHSRVEEGKKAGRRVLRCLVRLAFVRHRAVALVRGPNPLNEKRKPGSWLCFATRHMHGSQQPTDAHTLQEDRGA